MKEEIAAAVVFMSRLIRVDNNISKEKAMEFSDHLAELLLYKFRNHWYADNPQKGQGYRCIRITPVAPDPDVKNAVTLSGLNYSDLRLPTELTVWVDPQDVCCRFGETHGAFCMLTSFKDGRVESQAHKVNIKELVEDQKKRDNKHINIVTTRTNMPQPQYYQIPTVYQPSSPITNIDHYLNYAYILTNIHHDHNYAYIPNYFETIQQCAGINPQPFHNSKRKNHKKGNYGDYGNYSTYYGNRAYDFSSKVEMNSATRQNMPGHDKSHCFRGKKQRANHVKVGSQSSTKCSNKETKISHS